MNPIEYRLLCASRSVGSVSSIILILVSFFLSVYVVLCSLCVVVVVWTMYF
jgi:hypothetical protein